MTEVPELVVELPGLLLSCIENLEAVELGQKYDQEYDLAKLRIQTTTLSLANWGQSFGIQADMQETPEVADVTQLLKSIKQRLEQACAASEKFKLRDNDVGEIINRPLSPEKQHVSQKIREWVHKYYVQLEGSVTKSTLPLYRRGQLMGLLAGIQCDLDDLIDPYPGPNGREQYENICQSQISELADTPEHLALFRASVIENGDSVTEKVVNREVEKRAAKDSHYRSLVTEAQNMKGIKLSNLKDVDFTAGNKVARGAFVTMPRARYENCTAQDCVGGSIHYGDHHY